MFSKPSIISIICSKTVSISSRIILKTTRQKDFLKAKEKFDSYKIFAEVTVAKINSHEVLGEGQFSKVNARQMSKKKSQKLIAVKTFSTKVGHTYQVSCRYDDD